MKGVLIAALAVIVLLSGCISPSAPKVTPEEVTIATDMNVVILPNIARDVSGNEQVCYSNNCLLIQPMCDKHLVCVIGYTAYASGILGGVDCKSAQEAPMFYGQYCPPG